MDLLEINNKASQERTKLLYWVYQEGVNGKKISTYQTLQIIGDDQRSSSF